MAGPQTQGNGRLDGREGRTGKMGTGCPGRASQMAQDAVT